MNVEEQIKALAELDGWRQHPRYDDIMINKADTREAHLQGDILTRYRTSYDAIIPLIQKQNDYIKIRMDETVRTHNTVSAMINLTASQLCEALLKATERWKA